MYKSLVERAEKRKCLNAVYNYHKISKIIDCDAEELIITALCRGEYHVEIYAEIYNNATDYDVLINKISDYPYNKTIIEQLDEKFSESVFSIIAGKQLLPYSCAVYQYSIRIRWGVEPLCILF